MSPSGRIAKVNKHTKFDHNFDIRRQLEHFKYEMNTHIFDDFYQYIPINFVI